MNVPLFHIIYHYSTFLQELILVDVSHLYIIIKITLNYNYMNSCVYSSFIFLINSMLFSLYKKYYYALSFKLLFLTSFVFHFNHTFITFLIDQLSIFNFMAYDLYYLYNNLTFTLYHCILLFFGIICFLISVILFCYGYVFKCFCYDPEHSDYYHSLVHYVTFVGHILVVLL